MLFENCMLICRVWIEIKLWRGFDLICFAGFVQLALLSPLLFHLPLQFACVPNEEAVRATQDQWRIQTFTIL